MVAVQFLPFTIHDLPFTELEIMSTSRIDIFKQMLVSDPINSSILFGLAKEYEKAGQAEEMIETLERYLAISDDEGNGYGMLARAYEKTGRSDKVRETYQRGIEVATKHGHPSMAEEYRTSLESDLE
jgi:predicted Zn-dependent protease